MPIYEFFCPRCHQSFELLMTGSDTTPVCPTCKSIHIEKQLSAHAAYSGAHRAGVPGAGDTACCGSSPAAASCAGPGSCCGKR